ncbi:MAG: hypothetical protein Q9171_007189, partial [Xanthocarpia ochracea]
MKLRSRPLYTKSDPSLRKQTPRPALAQITVPNRSARRKAPDHTYPTKKRRHIMETGHTSGRALRSGKAKAADTADEDFVLEAGEQSKQAFHGSRSPVRRSARQPPAGAMFSQMSLVQLNDLSSRDSEATSSKSRKESPEKTPSTPRRGEKGLDQGLKGDQLVIAILASCSPPILLRSIEKVRQLGYEIPSRVIELHRLLKNVPPANIPVTLQKAYIDDANTPRKSKEPLADHNYSSSASDVWPEARLEQLKEFLDHITETAEFNENTNAQERQWGSVVHHVLDAFATWPLGKSVRTLNITLSQGGSSKDSSGVDNDEGKGTGISKLIDWAMGLKLSEMEVLRISRAFSKLDRPLERSVNQTFGNLSYCPLFLLLEVKKSNQKTDPRIQLAIWASAAFTKYNMHAWDTSFPIPGVTVNGHEWELFLFYERNDTVGSEGIMDSKRTTIMMGPTPLGSTKSLNRAWHLLHKIHILMEWGAKQYRA